MWQLKLKFCSGIPTFDFVHLQAFCSGPVMDTTNAVMNFRWYVCANYTCVDLIFAKNSLQFMQYVLKMLDCEIWAYAIYLIHQALLTCIPWSSFMSCFSWDQIIITYFYTHEKSTLTVWKKNKYCKFHKKCIFQITQFMRPTWGSPGSCRPQMGPMLAPRTLLSGCFMYSKYVAHTMVTPASGGNPCDQHLVIA